MPEHAIDEGASYTTFVIAVKKPVIPIPALLAAAVLITQGMLVLLRFVNVRNLRVRVL